MSMDTPDNYYATLGVPLDADNDTLKRAYRQLARRYHPDLAGEAGAVQMKRVNRAYDVLSDPEKRRNYDTVMGGMLDLRKGGMVRPRPVQRRFDPSDDIEFSGLSIFSTKGPFRAGPCLRTQLGVISAVSSVETPGELRIAAGSLDGKGIVWRQQSGEGEESQKAPVSFAADPALTVESLRELRFSTDGEHLAGWGRLGLHTWNTQDGTLLWSYGLEQRAVSAHYSLDAVLQEISGENGVIWLALPLQREDPLAPRMQGVRGTDVIQAMPGREGGPSNQPLVCAEDEIEKRQFWAVRLRALTRDARVLVTLSCANVPGETEQMIVLRRWDLTAKTRFGGKVRPQIVSSITAGLCADCTPPYTVTPDAHMLAFVHAGRRVRLHDTSTGTYSELASGAMGASSRLAISPDGQWVAVAREDSEINEGVVDVWSVQRGEVAQKLYHPWQISALHFGETRLIVALTDGTVQVWQ
jgi:hypothetical protein